MYIHSINWLHKAIRSDNIVFYWDGSRPNLEQPILAGYEYARHDAHDISERPDPNAAWDIYRWPSIQGEAPTAVHSQKIFDIYSLGLVLMEILSWKPLGTLLEIPDISTVTLSQSKGIRHNLLKESGCLDNVLDTAGKKYYGVVRRCIEGYLDDEVGQSGLGIKVNDNESDVHTSILLNLSHYNPRFGASYYPGCRTSTSLPSSSFKPQICLSIGWPQLETMFAADQTNPRFIQPMWHEKR